MNNNCKMSSFIAVLSFLLLLLTSCDAFVPPSHYHHRALVANLHQTVLPSDTTNNDAVLTQPQHDYSTYSAAQITQAQKNAEEEARRIFDPFAMNALFVNVEGQTLPICLLKCPTRLSRNKYVMRQIAFLSDNTELIKKGFL